MERSVIKFDSDVNFCPRCGAILPTLEPTGGLVCLICRLEVEVDTEALAEHVVSYEVLFNSRNNYKDEQKLKRAQRAGGEGPLVERRCPRCGNDTMSYASLQLRSADEGQTVFYTCTKCQFKETENSWLYLLSTSVLHYFSYNIYMDVIIKFLRNEIFKITSSAFPSFKIAIYTAVELFVWYIFCIFELLATKAVSGLNQNLKKKFALNIFSILWIYRSNYFNKCADCENLAVSFFLDVEREVQLKRRYITWEAAKISEISGRSSGLVWMHDATIWRSCQFINSSFHY